MSFVDNRVVKMAFDNADFEKNVGTTLSTIDKLKAALNFDGAIEGLKGISNAARGVSFDAMETGVYAVQTGFSALDVVATRVLQNITDMAFSAGKSLLTSITVEPLKAGLEEYETQINAVQTILANTNDALIEQGLTTEHDRIEKINSVLDDLNTYADMTIYNFTEMTRNIGTFTAAGVELDTAATSIKGIANLAAMSGSNSQQASTAMYQLSQAIAAGSVKLQDWNSVVNAGMGGKLFQNELIDTAKAMGVVDEQFIALTNGATTFRESLSSGWITAEVLTNTLEKFTAGSEGYTKSQVEQMKKLWEARGYSKTMIDEMVGSLKVLTDEEEKNLRTKWAEKGFSDEQIDHILQMGTAATDAATKVKTFSQLIETLKEALQSGWTQSWEYIIGDFEQAKRLWTEISDILGMYIGKSATARNEMLKQWSEATYAYNEAGELIYAADGKLVEGGKMIADEMGGREAVIQSIRNTFQGLLEVGVQFRDAWDWYFTGKDKGDKENPLDDLSLSGEKLIAMSKQLLSFTENFKKALGTAEEPSELLLRLRSSFEFFATSMRNGVMGLRDAFSGVTNILDAFFHSSFFSIDHLNSIITSISTVTGLVQDFGAAIKKHFGNDTTGQNREGLMKFFGGLQGIIESVAWVKLDFISNGLRTIWNIIEHIIGPGTTFSTILGDIGDKLSALAHGIDAIFNNEDVSKFEGMFSRIEQDLKPFIDSIKEILNIKPNGFVTGFQAFFNQLKSIMDGSLKGLDIFEMLEKVLGSILNIVKAIVSVVTPIFKAFTDVFGPSLIQIASYLTQIIDRVYAFTSSLVLNEEVMQGLYKLFEGIFTVLRGIASIFIDGLIASWDALASIFSELLPSSQDLGKNLGDIGEALKNFGQYLLEISSGEADLPSLADGIGLLGEKITGFIKAVKDSKFLKDVGSIFVDIFAKIKEALFGGENNVGVLDKVGEALKNFINNIKLALIGDDGLDVGDIMANGGIIFALKKLIDFLKDSFGADKGLFDTIKETISDVGKALCDTFEMIQNRLKFDALEKIAQSILMIAGALFIIALIDSDKLVQSLLAIGILMQSMELLMESITELEGVGVRDIAATAAAMVSLGAALLMVAIACKLLSTSDPNELAVGLAATVLLIKALTVAAQDLASESGRIMKGASGLIALAIAVDLLVIPMKILGGMEWSEIAKGLLATTLLIYGLVGAASQIGDNFSFGKGAGLLLLAFGIKVMADALSELAQFNLGQIVVGLVGFAGALAAVVVALKVLDKSGGGKLMATAAAIFIMAQAMKAMASAVSSLGNMAWEDLQHGVQGFALSLAALVAATVLLEKFGSGEAALGLAALSASMLLLAEALKIVGSLDFFGQIVPGLIGLGGALAIFVVAANFITPVMAASMLAVAGAIALLGVGVIAFSAGLTSLGLAITTSGTALLWFLTQLITFLPMAATALANAIAQFIVALARNISNIYSAFVLIAKTILRSFVELIPELAAIGKTMMIVLLQAIIEETPLIFQTLSVIAEQFWAFLNEQVSGLFGFLTNFFTELFAFLQTEGPILVETLRLMLDTVLQAIIQEAPVIGETLLVLLQTILTVIQTAIPEITFTLANLILSLLQQLAEFVPQMAQAAMDILLGFLTVVGENIWQITEAAINIAIAFMDGIAAKMPELVDSAFNLIIQWIDGLATAIDNNHDALWDAVGHLIQSIVDAIIDGIGKVLDAGGQMLSEFTSGLNAQDVIDGIFNAGANLVQGFIDGILSLGTAVWNAACSLATDAWNAITGTLDEHSPSRLTFGGGVNFVLGFLNGLIESTPKVVQASAAMAYAVLDSFDRAIGSEDLDPHPITLSPVIDDSGIQNGIEGYMGDINNTITGTASISGTLKADSEMKAQLADILSKPTDFTDILNGMNTLDRNLENYTEAVTKMQVVMDTGTLVGELSPGVDYNLGRSANLARRGV